MSDHHSPPPRGPGAKQDSEDATAIAPLSSAVDMSPALGFGTLEIAPHVLEDKTALYEVSFD